MFLRIAFSLFLLMCAAQADDFFTIQSIKVLKAPDSDGVGVWTYIPLGKLRKLPDKFIPCLEVKVKTREKVSTTNLIAKIYFFDSGGRLIFSRNEPSLSGTKKNEAHARMPALLQAKPEKIFFDIPSELSGKTWTAVVVVGDNNELQAANYPSNASLALIDYPEKALIGKGTRVSTERKVAVSRLIEHVATTDNPAQPQITLFLRFPDGVSDGSQLQGVLALCMLAPSVDYMRRDLQQEELDGDYIGLLEFANKNKLAVLAWGSRRVWAEDKNYDELSKTEAKEADEAFDKIATGWERGVRSLCESYNIAMKDFLLVGHSASAQWAKRLCLRKPNYFLAIHVNIPSSFDKPTPEAARVLWCLTTGELESGYERSLKFWAECKKLGYPILYKAIPGLGHSSDPRSVSLGMAFLEYALSVRSERDQYFRTASVKSEAEPWPAGFRKPPFYGDVADNIERPAAEAGQIPLEWRTALPTDVIAKAWEAKEAEDVSFR